MVFGLKKTVKYLVEDLLVLYSFFLACFNYLDSAILQHHDRQPWVDNRLKTKTFAIDRKMAQKWPRISGGNQGGGGADTVRWWGG